MSRAVEEEQHNRERVKLTATPSGEEIRKTLFQMGPLKAPGPDGMHAIFFPNCWEEVSGDLIPFIQGVFRAGTFPDELNKFLICLIPKVEQSKSVKQFRPIGLCNTIYKLITKLLVNRLRPILQDIISPHQNAFIARRGSDINFTAANEVMHSMKSKKGKKGWFALKIDLEKAYD